jgi:hypothetical protein
MIKRMFGRPPTDEETDAWLFGHRPMPLMVKVWMISGWAIAVGLLLASLAFMVVVCYGVFWLIDWLIWGIA